jgi:competence ComEA-like helix-hairpin-helix protein
MRRGLILLVLIFLIINISALCEQNQININQASLEELDKLSSIGPVKAQAIIDTRPFNSVDDLLNVTGIGEKTLEKIKTQGLACIGEASVVNEESKTENTINKDDKTQTKASNTNKVDKKQETIKEEDYQIPEAPIQTNAISQEDQIKREDIQREVIVLGNSVTKDIKSEKIKENSYKNNYAIYGIIGFCILLLFLFIIKKYKRVKKNEFR